jgi:hypothetical protein
MIFAGDALDTAFIKKIPAYPSFSKFLLSLCHQVSIMTGVTNERIEYHPQLTSRRFLLKVWKAVQNVKYKP